ncbi:hypothetical protein [Rubinisphaera sp. JC750]|uniref:PIN-like domain-containing protein n=1 Tax=Rubinisphaera sp. JC750 TaxID=2898658 RepID=UPI001F3A3DB0|nr:hypothetical protein [Rubinisphaera sp. JC750]
MNKPKILFDECIGRPLVTRLTDFVTYHNDGEPELCHLLDLFGPGVYDEEWIPRIASEDWTVITQDRGSKGRKKGTPLPEVCEEFGVTHILLSRRVAQFSSFLKAVAIVSVWPQIVDIANDSRKTCYRLEPSSHSDSTSNSGKLVLKKVLRPPAEDRRLFRLDDLDD